MDTLVEAFCIKLETAADATSLKSASVAVRLAELAALIVDDVGTSGIFVATPPATDAGADAAEVGDLAVVEGRMAST